MDNEKQRDNCLKEVQLHQVRPLPNYQVKHAMQLLAIIDIYL